jgi:hypothetical protein
MVTLPDGTQFESEVSLHDLPWDDDRAVSVAWLGTLTTGTGQELAAHTGETVRLWLGSGEKARAVVGTVSLLDQGGEAVELLGVGGSPFSTLT